MKMRWESTVTMYVNVHLQTGNCTNKKLQTLVTICKAFNYTFDCHLFWDLSSHIILKTK